DTGIGISPEALGRIFEEFQQADTSTTRQYGGTGLGLSISRNLAQLLGGDLMATSTLGVGSIFTLVIPLRFDSSPESRLAEAQEGRGAAPTGGFAEPTKSPTSQWVGYAQGAFGSGQEQRPGNPGEKVI